MNFARILEFVSERNGSLSSQRLVFLAYMLGILGVWIASCVTAAPITVKPIDPSVTTLIAVIATSKVTQRFGEKADKDKDVLPPAPKV